MGFFPQLGLLRRGTTLLVMAQGTASNKRRGGKSWAWEDQPTNLGQFAPEEALMERA
jgi:hypothetical protein